MATNRRNDNGALRHGSGARRKAAGGTEGGQIGLDFDRPRGDVAVKINSSPLTAQVCAVAVNSAGIVSLAHWRS